MNLRAVANRATSAINPNLTAILRVCTGYASVDYVRRPTYAATRAVYANQQLTCVDRVDRTGGDLLNFDNDDWLVIAVLEGWSVSGWCKVAVAKQLPAS